MDAYYHVAVGFCPRTEVPLSANAIKT